MPHVPPSASLSGGYTLVELVVAAAILGLAITGVMSMLGTGRQLEFDTHLRRQARTIAARTLEDTLYHFSRYFNSLPSYSTTVTLDSGTASPISANLRLTVYFEDDLYLNQPGSGTVGVPMKKIRARVRWTLAGRTDSVYVWKWIASVR